MLLEIGFVGILFIIYLVLWKTKRMIQKKELEKIQKSSGNRNRICKP